MDDCRAIYFFEENPEHQYADLLNLLRIHNDSLLLTFFDRAYTAIRAEVGDVPLNLRRQFPCFNSLSDLCRLNGTHSLHPALKHSLEVVRQIGRLISICSAEHTSFPATSHSYVTGFGVGSLVAAVVCCSRDVPELSSLSTSVIRLSFRLGLLQSRTTNAIDPSTTVDSSWCLKLDGVSSSDMREAIKDFHEKNPVPTPSEIYVSAASIQSIEISGPPSRLEEFARQNYLGRHHAEKVSTQILAHAPHLYTQQDVKTLLSTITTASWTKCLKQTSYMSASSGTPSWATSLQTLIEEALTDTLTRPVQGHKLLDVLVAASGFDDVSKAIFYTFGNSNITENMYVSVEQSFREQNCSRVDTIKDTNRSSSHHNSLDTPVSKAKVSVVGMSGRFPDADNLEAYWKLLFEGRDVHKPAPETRWDVKTHVDVTGKKKNTAGTPFGCWLDGAGLFDAKFFHLSPRETPQIDPAQRLALLTAYEALEQAGLVPGATPSTQKDRVGVFYGVTSNDWMETNSAQNIDTYMIPGGNRAFIPGRINYFFKFSGPSYSIDTACSSSLAAVHAACNALWRGDIDTAIVGGTNVLTNPDFTAGLDRGHFLSRTGNCKTFDDGADGYCRGEGVTTLILKREDDAKADCDPVLANILSAYTNHSADAESITRPHGGAQKAIFNKLLDDAGVESREISYVEMHGTGTQAGDAEEMRSVLETFAPANSDLRVGLPLYLGSAKANIGHGEAASGVSSLAKVLLMMKHNIIPPHCGIKTKINHKFPTDLDRRNVHIAKRPESWPRPQHDTRKVFVNNFSAAGGNSAVLIEDGPLEILEEGSDPRTFHCVNVSAKCAKSLSDNIDSMLGYLASTPNDDLTLSRLAYTTTARRIHHAHRVSVYGANISDIEDQLLAAKKAGTGSARSKSEPNITFAFTGQGSQYATMGKQYYECFSSFKYEVDNFDKLARGMGFPSFVSVISGASTSLDDLSPVVIQLAIVSLEVAMARLWMSWAVQPKAVIGHSLGEYAALNISGILSDVDMIYLVGRRAELLQKYCHPDTHSMLAIKAAVADVQPFIEGTESEIACINGPNSTVVAGPVKCVKNLKAQLSASHIKSTLLNTAYAFHSSQVNPVLKDLETCSRGVKFMQPTIPLISTARAEVIVSEGVLDASYPATHCRVKVDVKEAVEVATRCGVLDAKTIIVEIGSQPVVSRMIQDCLGPTVTALPSLRQGEDSWKLISQALTTLYMKGTDIRWQQYHKDFKAAHRVLSLPAYAWDLKNYWIQYINDWSLRKGEPVIVQDTPVTKPTVTQEAAVSKPEHVSVHKPKLGSTEIPKLETTTIHKVVKEEVGPTSGIIVVESDLSRPDLNPLIKGHLVNGIPLATPSIYAEIALSIGQHLLKYRPSMEKRLVSVDKMTIEKALISQPNGSQILRATVEVDWAEQMASCKFESINGTNKPARHSRCCIRFSDPTEARSALARRGQTARDRIASLRKSLATGGTYRFNRAMIYKMVSALAQFDPKYMGLKEIVLDSDALEAYSEVSFDCVTSDGNYHTHPAYIDALSQVGGFVMNANDNSNLDEEVFINHGWGSFQLFEPLSKDKVYQVHVKMRETPGRKFEGDLTIFDGEIPMAQFGSIVLQGVGKRALHFILSREKDLGAPKQPRQSQPKELPKSNTVAALSPPTTEIPVKTISIVEQRTTITPSIHTSVTETAAISITGAGERMADAALRIISEESGIALEDLTDDSTFTEVGIDSLLNLVIDSRFNEELDLHFDSSEMFTSLPTIKHLKDHLKGMMPEVEIPVPTIIAPQQQMEKVQTIVTVTETAEPAALLHAAPTLNIEQQLSITGTIENPRKSETSKVEFQAKIDEISQSIDTTAFTGALQIISEESGVAVEDLTDDTSFLDIGIDSLLSLMIVGRLREELEVDLPTEASLYTNYPTVKDLRSYLCADSLPSLCPPSIGTPSESSSVDYDAPTPFEHSIGAPGVIDGKACEVSVVEIAEPEPFPIMRSHFCLPASSVVLQGRPRSDPQTLILFPDGGGSASSYSSLPRISPNLAVIGLNCPYARKPDEMDCSLDALLSSYIVEIRRRQPEGPYNLGGWSSGGVLAYATAQRLIQEGEEVSRLILIDAPAPMGLDRLPQKWFDFTTSIDLFGKNMPATNSTKANAPPPEWLIPHFKATIEMLHDYFADPLPAGHTPATTLVWAGDCVLDGVRFPKLPPSHDDTEGMKFLTERRTDFSAGKWARLFPGEDVDVEIVREAHHFSLVGKYAPRLAEIVRLAMQRQY